MTQSADSPISVSADRPARFDPTCDTCCDPVEPCPVHSPAPDRITPEDALSRGDSGVATQTEQYNAPVPRTSDTLSHPQPPAADRPAILNDEEIERLVARFVNIARNDNANRALSLRHELLARVRFLCDIARKEGIEAGYIRAKAEVAARLIEQGASGSIRV